MPEVLTSKLRVPTRKPLHVDRPRLRALLQPVPGHKLTVITAPAGFGKTTLLATWVEATATPVAWLSLDAGDDDVTRFLHHLVAALSVTSPAACERARSYLDVQHQPSALVVIGMVLNDLDESAPPFTLVMDDFHAIASPAIHECVSHLVAHAPPSVHVVVVSRSDPPLALARMRARGELTELRASDLRFTSSEAAAFLDAHVDHRLSPSQVGALEARTEGWAAGLQLVALALRDRRDVDDFIERFAGSHHYVMDYLTEEVLGRQSEAVQRFLLSTSILDRLSGPLCDAVTGGDGGSDELRRLERANLFLVPLDDERRWYRFHRLFADVLKDRLRQRASPADVHELHRRASSWFEEAGMPTDAVGHALASGDVERSARLVESLAEDMWSRGELTALRGWIDALPQPVVHGRPRLLLTKAWCRFLLRSYDATSVGAMLDEAERSIEERAAPVDPPSSGASLRGMLAAVRAAVASAQEDAESTLSFAREAHGLLGGDAGAWTSVLSLSEGLAFDAIGDLVAADGSLTEAIASGRAVGNAYVAEVALVNLARVRFERGALRGAAELSERALESVGEHDGGRSPVASYPHVVLGHVMYEWNDLVAAELHYEVAIERARVDEHVRASIDGALGLAYARFARSDVAGANAALQMADDVAHTSALPVAAALVTWHRANVALRAGRVTDARRLVDRARRVQHGSMRGGPRLGDVIEARVLAAEGRFDDALRQLGEAVDSADGGGRVRSALEASIVRAAVLVRQGSATEALAIVVDAIDDAEREGFVRVFADEGAPIAHLLTNLDPDRRAPEYVAKLLSACSSRRSGGEPNALGSAAALNDRELAVLRLMSGRRTDKEIAKALSLSVSTIKWYSQRVFAKLGTHRRTEAVARAKDLGIL